MQEDFRTFKQKWKSCDHSGWGSGKNITELNNTDATGDSPEV